MGDRRVVLCLGCGVEFFRCLVAPVAPTPVSVMTTKQKKKDMISTNQKNDFVKNDVSIDGEKSTA